MSRLVGKRADARLPLTSLLLVAIVASVALEYLGVFDLIPGFGRERGAWNEQIGLLHAPSVNPWLSNNSTEI